MKIKLNSTKFPKIGKRKILKSDTFLTSTADDFCFAKAQLSQIDDNINFQERIKKKPWERMYNNIYNKPGKSNRQIISLIKHNNKVKSSFNLDWKDQHFYTQTEVGNINESNNISTQVRTFSEIQNKYNKQRTYLDSFVSDNKKIFINKILINIMKKEQNKIINKGKNYQKALKEADMHLSTDIKEFSNFVDSQNLVRSKNIFDLDKIVQINLHLVDEIKNLSAEYNFIIHEIKKYLKLLVDLKYYSENIHHIIGGESEIMRCSELDNIDYKNMSENDIIKILSQIKKEFNIDQGLLFENNIFNIQKKPFDDQLKLESLFKLLEQNIRNILNKKNLYDEEIDEIQKEGKTSVEELNLKIYNLQNEYLLYLKEYEIEKKNIQNFCSDPYEENYIKYACKLLKEIDNFIKQTNGIKIKNVEINEDSIFTDAAIPTIKYLQKKESQINELHVQMEGYHKEDPELFNRVVINQKNYNRRIKLLNEKKVLEMKHLLRNKNIIDKLNKVIIKGKQRYKVPPPLKQHRSVDKKNNNDENDIMSEFIGY